MCGLRCSVRAEGQTPCDDERRNEQANGALGFVAEFDDGKHGNLLWASFVAAFCDCDVKTRHEAAGLRYRLRMPVSCGRQPASNF